MAKVRSTLDYVSVQQTRGSSLLNAKLVRQRFDSIKTLYRKDLYAHYGCVNAIEFSNDGEWMASGGDDKRVLVWNVDQTLNRAIVKPKAMRGEHNSNIFCLSFDSNHAKLFSAGNDEQVILHDVASGETSDVFLHDEAVYGLSVDPTNENVFASACDDGRILLWDTRASTTDSSVVAGCNSAFHAVMHNPAVPVLLVTANAKEGVELWDVRKPRERVIRYGGSFLSQSAMSVRFNGLGTHILALRRRLPPVLYELCTVHAAVEFDHSEYYNSCTMKSCCFAGDRDQYVLSGSDDFKLYMWKVPSDVTVRKTTRVKDAHLVLRGHRSIVNQVRYNKPFSILASSGVEKIIKLWSTFPIDNNYNFIEDKEGLRKVYSHEEYINLVLESGQFMTHDYSHHSVQEDPRMMAFFDSLVQRDIEGWTSDSSDTSMTNKATCFEVQTGSSSSSSSSSSMSSTSSSDSSDENAEAERMPKKTEPRSPEESRVHRMGVSSVISTAVLKDDCQDEDNGAKEDKDDMTSERISRLIAKKRSDLMRKSARLTSVLKGKKLKIRVRSGAKKDGKSKTNGVTNTDDNVSSNNAGNPLSVQQNGLDRRKLLMKKRAKLLRNALTISDCSSESDGETDQTHANGVSMDLSVCDVPLQETALLDDKEHCLNGKTTQKSNGTVENGASNHHNVTLGVDSEASGSGINGVARHETARPPPLPPLPPLPLSLPPLPPKSPPPSSSPPPVPRRDPPGIAFQSKNASSKRHSRNYRKRNADDMQED